MRKVLKSDSRLEVCGELARERTECAGEKWRQLTRLIPRAEESDKLQHYDE